MGRVARNRVLQGLVISPTEKTPNPCKTTSDSKCVFTKFVQNHIWFQVCILGFSPHLSNSYSTLLYGSPPWSPPCSRWRRKTCSHSLCHRSASPDHCQSWQVAAVCHVRGPQGGGRSSRLPESKVNFFGQSNGCWCYCDILWAVSCIVWTHLDVSDVWAGLELGSSPHGPRSRVVGNIGKGEEEVVIAQLGVAWPAIDRNTLQE